MIPRPRLASLGHYLAVFGLAVAVGILFIREPGFGDDLNYWSLSFDLHEIGPSAWSAKSFHDLRWPVWGVIWLWQSVFGAGLSSYYGPAILYLAAAALLVFKFGRLVFPSVTRAWICVLAFLFSPFLDAVIFRPMPDLSESLFGGCALLAWWTMMRSSSRSRAWLYGILSGVSVGLAFSNRASGILVAPMLAVVTLIFYRARWRWLLVPAAFSALFVVLEGFVYYRICGDWLHSFHANLSGAGAKDVEVMSAWRLPIRYLPGFFHGNFFVIVYALLSGLGLWAGWHRWGKAGQLMVVWFGALYLEYSCAIQSIHPLRPLIGSTLRYLAVFSLPMSFLAAFGLMELGQFSLQSKWAPLQKLRLLVSKWPALTVLASLVALVAISNRPLFNLGYAVDLRREISALPAGTKIFSHHAMYDVACLLNAEAAHRLVWIAPLTILNYSKEQERLAAGCDEFWYLRKLVWLNQRKVIERQLPGKSTPLASYFEQPERDWILNGVLGAQDGADFMLYRRRSPGSPPPRQFLADSPEFHQLIPTLPASWNNLQGSRTLLAKWTLPEAFRGKLLSIQLTGQADTTEPVTIKLSFKAGKVLRKEYDLRPNGQSTGGKDLFAVDIPRDADTCDVELRLSPHTKEATLTGFQAFFDDTR